MSAENQWILEWSHSQRAFHVHQISDAIRLNARAMIDGRKMDYVTIASCDEREQLDPVVKMFMDVRDKQDANAREGIDP